jgi:hypothetical protein
MAIEIPNVLIAYGKVNADGTKASGAGFASAKTGAGVYTLTLDAASPASETNGLASIDAAALSKSEAVYSDTSDTVKTVNTGDAGANADHAFSFVIMSQPGR